ncbi:glycosyltransferase [Candidatus Woesearchaeota archaeon]|nr:glycosyltransferase [Candidatus Woesearchaeota archaeon]
MGVDLSIVIPTYNEERRILKTLRAYASFFDKKLKCEYIVADQSGDSTREVVRNFMKKHKNVHLLALPGRGKGGAVMEAFKVAKGSMIGFTDADSATSPEEYFKLLRSMEGYDAVIGSRGLSRSNVLQYNQSVFRRFGSFVLGTLFVRVMFGLSIKDTQCGAKIFRAENLVRVIPKMRIRNSIFDVELLWRFNKVGRIKELPIRWVDGAYSNFRWYEIIPELVWLLRVRFGV